MSAKPCRSFLTSSFASLILLVQLLLLTGTSAQPPTNWTASPFNPTSLPLAVKNPYLNAWAPLAGGSAAVNQAWPRSYIPLENILEWYAAIRVDDTTYKLLGEVDIPNVAVAAQKSFIFTPTQTSYILDCGGKMSVNMTFVTPIEATDLVRLSTPFSYLQIIAASTDGQSHNVKVYSDVSGAWIAGDISQVSSWAVDDSDQFVSLQRQLANPIPFTESANRPQDATVYYAAHKSAQLSWQIGPSHDTRASFANGTALNNALQTGENAVGPPSDTNTILGLAIDFGLVTSQTTTALFTLGIVRDPVVQYTNGEGKVENRSAYFWSQLSDVTTLMADVINHYPDALASATALDQSLSQAAKGFGSDYVNLLSLSTRQAMAALEYTIPKDASTNKYNTSDVKAFMKDMGYMSTGVANPTAVVNPASVNPVDVMYASMPVYLYLNPDILGYLLKPLLEYQSSSSQYSNPFAAQNLGDSFPNATGNSNAHNQGIEQSANMLIMCLAHAQASGDGSLLSQYYDLLSGWGNYLVDTAMNPQQQRTSFSDALSNNLAHLTDQTNLALKGIIGIGAMGRIAESLQRTVDQSRFDDTAANYTAKWKSLALSSSGQPLDAFGSSSAGFLYNLYADTLLGLNLTDKIVYNAFTANLNTGTAQFQFGVPVDPSGNFTRADWMLFSAAISTSSDVRTDLIGQVVRYNSQSLLGSNNQPFPVVYNAATGEQGPVGQGSPAVGAMFAPLALGISKKLISPTGTTGQTSTGSNGDDDGGDSSSKKLSTGAIVGNAVAGAVVVGALVGFAVFIFFKRHRNRRKPRSIMLDMDEMPHEFVGTPSTGPNGSYGDVRETQPLAQQAYHNITPFTLLPRGNQADYLQTFNDSVPTVSYAESGGGMSINPPTNTVASTPPAERDRTFSNATSVPRSQQESQLMSEMELMRGEMARIRMAVEQGQMLPPPGYYEDLAAVFPPTQVQDAGDVTVSRHNSITKQ